MSRFCNKCNAPVEDGGSFCTECGSDDIREEVAAAEDVALDVSSETAPLEGNTQEQVQTAEQPVAEQQTAEVQTTDAPQVVEAQTVSTTPVAEAPVSENAPAENVDPYSLNGVSTQPPETQANSFANVPDFMNGDLNNVEEEQIPIVTSPPAYQAPVVQPVQQQTAMQPPQAGMPPMPPRPRSARPRFKKSKKNYTLIFGILGVALVCFIISIVFILGALGNKRDVQVPQQEQQKPFDTSDMSANGNGGSAGVDVEKIFTPENSFRVGQEGYGYISIPNTWTYFKDKNSKSNNLQYTDDGTWIVTLYGKPTTESNAVDWANMVYNNIAKSGATNITTSKVIIDNYTALTIAAYYPSQSTYLTAWFLETKNGYTHYLAIEGPQSSGDYYNIIYSFNEYK